MADYQDPVTVSGSKILGHSVRPDGEYRVKVYDFKRPDKFSLEQIRTVQIVHETLGRLWSTTLKGIAGVPVAARCTGIDQMTFVEFMESIPAVSALMPVSMSPLRGSVVLQVDGALSQFLVRAVCGGRSAEVLEEPKRPLTELETVVLRDIAERLLPNLDEAWRNVIDLRSTVHTIETDPQYAQIVPPTEMIILGSMEVTIGDRRAFINLAIPYLTIEPIIPRLSMQWWFGRRRAGASTVSEKVSELPVTAELYSEAPPVRLSDLSAIVGGEPLELPGLAREMLTLAAGSVPIAEVSADPAGLTEGSLTLRVLSHRADAAEPGGGADDREVSMPAMLFSAIEGLAAQVREVKQAVEEIRTDRETLLAELADPAAVSIGDLDEPDLDRRHHLDIALALAGEDPVTVGFLLAGLAPETAAAVLADTDPAQQPSVVRAIAMQSDGDRSLHRKLLSFIGRRIARSSESTTAGGPEVVAQILNNTPRSVEKHVMETFMREDRPFFDEIARRMFVFEDFVLVDSTAIRKLAGRVAPEEFALAMKGMPAEVTGHLMEALDAESAEAVDAAVNELGRVRRRDVESAQRDIIEELRQLEQSGEVVIARPDEVIE